MPWKGMMHTENCISVSVVCMEEKCIDVLGSKETGEKNEYILMSTKHEN